MLCALFVLKRVRRGHVLNFLPRGKIIQNENSYHDGVADRPLPFSLTRILQFSHQNLLQPKEVEANLEDDKNSISSCREAKVKDKGGKSAQTVRIQDFCQLII